MKPTLKVRELGLQPYLPVWSAMRALTDRRTAETADEIWMVEHPPVYTQGQAGKPEHVIAPADIPVVQTDRGGQVTYHGPGQLVVYPLLDLARAGLGIRSLVEALEEVVIRMLAEYRLTGSRKPGAPGVFLGQAKIASIGMRVRRGCTFHGLAFNLDLDLEPFSRINPCGYANQPMTRLCDHVDVEISTLPTGRRFAELLAELIDLDWTLEAADDEGHALAAVRGNAQAEHETGWR